MIGKMLRLGRMTALVVLAVGLAGCAAPTSELSASEVWVRAAAADATGSDTAGSGMDMSSDSTMTMDSGTPAMAPDSSSTPAMVEDSATGGGVSAAYMTLTNGGGASDTLVSVSTDAAAVVELHTSEIDADGVMRMRPLTNGLEVPADGSVTLEPGGNHIMLMDLQRDLNPGDTVTLTLTFASGKTLTVEAEIRPPQ